MKLKNVILKTREVIADYFASTVSQRLAGGSGSRYPQYEDAESLVAALEDAEWVKYDHPAIGEGCDGFKSEIPGEIGMIELENLDDDDEVQLVDPKRTGSLSAVVKGDSFVQVDFSVMIVGDHEGDLVVFTFHPGDPVRPSTIEGTPRTVTVREARDLGFDLAKIKV